MQQPVSAHVRISDAWQEDPANQSVCESGDRELVFSARTVRGWGNLLVYRCKPVEGRLYLEHSVDDLTSQLVQFGFSDVTLQFLEHRGIPVIKVTAVCGPKDSVFIHYLVAFATETLLVTGTFTIDHPEAKTDLLRFVEPVGKPNDIVARYGPALAGRKPGS